MIELPKAPGSTCAAHPEYRPSAGSPMGLDLCGDCWMSFIKEGETREAQRERTLMFLERLRREVGEAA
jgi:hypothetical protein